MNFDQETLTMALTYLDKIGTKIGMTADTIWPWLVRQQYVYIGTALTVLVIGCILMFFAVQISSKYHPFDDDLYGTADVDMRRLFYCVLMIMSVVGVIIGSIATLVNLPKLFNPEYYALKDLLQLIR